MEKLELKPRLRFPNFKDNWKSKIINELFTFKVTNSYSRENLNYNEGNIYNIHYGDIHKKFQTQLDLNFETLPFINNDINVSRISVDNYCIVGDIVLADASEDLNDVGKSIEIVNIDEKKVLAGLHTILARPNANVFSKGFGGYLFKSPRVRKLIQNEAQGTKVLSISATRLSKIVLNFPSIEEQKKIALFLISVDAKLQSLKKKKELLDQYKKGVMQKIFSQELRFKDENGNEFPDWDEKKLGEIGDFQTSSIDKLSRDDEKEVYLVNYMNVYRHEKIDNHTVKNFQVVTAKENQIKSCNLKRGDILFTPSSETPEDIGHSVVIFEDINNAVFSYHLMRFRPNVEIDILYSHYFCNIPFVLEQLSKLATGSTRFTISVSSFSKINVKLPCFEEQNEIANFLNNIDEKIELLGNIIDKTENWKKGLLQKLFV